MLCLLSNSYFRLYPLLTSFVKQLSIHQLKKYARESYHSLLNFLRCLNQLLSKGFTFNIIIFLGLLIYNLFIETLAALLTNTFVFLKQIFLLIHHYVQIYDIIFTFLTRNLLKKIYIFFFLNSYF